ncbi:hypothetical protein P7K49_020780 [Saguinus oedipus]|uniref:Uncharacterized protein n=1 Tax=Saguinus oedipus TaxID=9490 RepID=A0ABQ9UQU1_SAGOE|nr:hypothetical protein P7K49_020780 [Saguinus oedipus]
MFYKHLLEEGECGRKGGKGGALAINSAHSQPGLCAGLSAPLLHGACGAAGRNPRVHRRHLPGAQWVTAARARGRRAEKGASAAIFPARKTRPAVGPSPRPARGATGSSSPPRSCTAAAPPTMRRLPRALLLLRLALLVAAGAPEAPVSAPRSLVWGPGLQAAVVLPVRYFYLQAANSEGQNFTRAPPGSVQPAALPRPAAGSPRVPAARESARGLRGVPPLRVSPPFGSVIGPTDRVGLQGLGLMKETSEQ